MDSFLKKNVCTLFFFLAYLLSGIYFALGTKFLLSFNIKALIFYSYFVFPLVVIIYGGFVYFKGKNPAIYFWISSAYWFLLVFYEIVTEGSMKPSAGFLISMLVISILCMVFLIRNKVRD